MLLIAWVDPEPLRWLENALLDVRFILRGERDPGHEVIIVAIDEKSLKEEGRWPWSRNKQAQLVQAIAAGGAKVIGLDIIYAEAEITEHRRGLQTIITEAKKPAEASPTFQKFLERKLSEADTDRQFAQSLHEAGNVVLALALLVPKAGAADREMAKASPVPLYIQRSKFKAIMRTGGDTHVEPPRATGSSPPLQPLADNAASLGHVYSLPDLRGITRHEHLAVRYGGDEEYYPSLALEVARLYLGVPKDRMMLMLGRGIRLDETFIPNDQAQRLLINYVGHERRFPYVSATDVLHHRVPKDILMDKAVLVGTTAVGTYDQKASPFSANFPGAEKNATVVENIIHGKFLKRSLWAEPITAGLILLFGITLGIVLPRTRALLGTAFTATVFVGYAAVAQYVFVSRGHWLDVVYPMLTIATVFVAITVLRFMTEERRAREIRAMFSSYVSPRIVAELIKDPEKAKLGGQRKELTMLFSDVVGFTTYCEQHPAEQVVLQLNEYLGAMTEVIFKWNGTLDKFFGDAVVAFWGAPLEQPNHAELAVKCALHMRKRLSELQEQWKARGLPVLEAGIGINTGEVLIGNIGAEGKKMDYTMVGDQVNLASRIEGITRKVDSWVLIAERTAAQVKDLIMAEDRADNLGRLGHVILRRIGAVKVKGKHEPVVVYGVVSLGRAEQSLVVEEGASLETLELTEK